jgi:hypothetical protein
VLQRTGLSILIHPGAPPLLGTWAPFSTISWAVWLLIFFSAVVVGAVLVFIDMLAAVLAAMQRELRAEEDADSAEAADEAAAARRFGRGFGAAPSALRGDPVSPGSGSRAASSREATGGLRTGDAGGAPDQDAASVMSGAGSVDAEVEIVAASVGSLAATAAGPGGLVGRAEAPAGAATSPRKGGGGGGSGGSVRQRRLALVSPVLGSEWSMDQIKADLSECLGARGPARLLGVPWGKGACQAAGVPRGKGACQAAGGALGQGGGAS